MRSLVASVRWRLLAVLSVLVVGALPLVLAACGGGKEEGVAQDVDRVALASDSLLKIIPREAPIVIRVTLDENGDQFRALDALAAKFGVQNARQQLFESINSGGSGKVKVEDVLGALGAEGILAFPDAQAVTATQGNDSGQPQRIMFAAQVADANRLRQLLTDAGATPAGNHQGVELLQTNPEDRDDPAFAAIDGDLVILATGQDLVTRALDSRKGGAPSIVDDPAFSQVHDEVPKDSLAAAYVNLAPFSALIGDALKSGTGGQLPQGCDFGRLTDAFRVSFVVGAKVQDDGADMIFAARTDADRPVVEFKNFDAEKLVKKAPREAFAAFAFQGLGNGLRAFLTDPQALSCSTPEAQRGIDQIRGLLAGIQINLDKDLLPVFDGQHMVYGTIVADKPAVVAVLTQKDKGKAKETLQKLRDAVAGFGQSIDPSMSQITPVDVGGTEGYAFGAPDGPAYVLLDDELVISNSVDALRQYEDHEGSIADRARFEDVVGDGDKNSLLYLDLTAAPQLYQILGGMFGSGGEIPPQAAPILNALGAFGLAGSSSDGGKRSASLFRFRTR